jgi:hypothetical protein
MQSLESLPLSYSGVIVVTFSGKVPFFASTSFQALFTNEDNDDNEENNGEVHCNNLDDKKDVGNDHNDDDDLHGFLLMMGLLNE